MSGVPRIDFHVLKSKEEEYYYLYIARLVEKAYHQKNKIFIFTATQADAIKIDKLLWTYRDSSFLPHQIIETNVCDAPILISHLTPPTECEVLVNLSQGVPAFYNQFQRIVEVVYDDEALKNIGRQKYRQYQQFSCAIQTHQQSM